MNEDHAGGASAALGFNLAQGLSLAAAPTFAIMALLTARLGGPEMLCSAGGSPLSGMVPMYLLMSAFHLAPWLKLISRRASVPAGEARAIHLSRGERSSAPNGASG